MEQHGSWYGVVEVLSSPLCSLQCGLVGTDYLVQFKVACAKPPCGGISMTVDDDEVIKKKCLSVLTR